MLSLRFILQQEAVCCQNVMCSILDSNHKYNMYHWVVWLGSLNQVKLFTFWKKTCICLYCQGWINLESERGCIVRHSWMSGPYHLGSPRTPTTVTTMYFDRDFNIPMNIYRASYIFFFNLELTNWIILNNISISFVHENSLESLRWTLLCGVHREEKCGSAQNKVVSPFHPGFCCGPCKLNDLSIVRHHFEDFI